MNRAKRYGLLAIMSLALLSVGCEQPGVGDPCVPEIIPSGGFLPNETYVEVNSVQCRTRACVVHGFRGGDPTNTVESGACQKDDPDSNEYCFSLEEVEEAIYCSCRCSASGDSSAPTCVCPDGFQCQDEVLTVGDEGVVGGYCVRKD